MPLGAQKWLFRFPRESMPRISEKNLGCRYCYPDPEINEGGARDRSGDVTYAGAMVYNDTTGLNTILNIVESHAPILGISNWYVH